MNKKPGPFLTLDNVSRDFAQKGGLFRASARLRAVNGVSFTVNRGETVGLVGESGSGKSTLARMAVRLLPPTTGDILLEGRSIFSGDPEFRKTLPSRIQMVFQDPFSSLNPRMRIGESVGEALKARKIPEKRRTEEVAAMLAMVGLDRDVMLRYPHEFSGGQRQRVAIARALVTRPDFVVLDEPTSSLDASVQAQVLSLLKDLQDSLGLTYLFISHDLAVISHMSDRVAVMRRGEVVEMNDAVTLFNAPEHPYTRQLLASVPPWGVAAAGKPAPGDRCGGQGPPRSARQAAGAASHLVAPPRPAGRGRP